MDLEKNNFINVKKISNHRFRENHHNIIIETTGDMRKLLLYKGKINIGFQRVFVEDCNPLMQCYHCLGFGHTAIRCFNQTNKPRCVHCAGEHKSSDCTKKEEHQCFNCLQKKTQNKETGKTNHRANSHECPIVIKMKIMAQQHINYN